MFDTTNIPERLSKTTGKPLSKETIKKYKTKLNILADEYGFDTPEKLLDSAPAVVVFMRNHSKRYVDMFYFLSAVFYAIGTQDFTKDPRGKPYYDEFQKIKKHSSADNLS